MADEARSYETVARTASFISVTCTVFVVGTFAAFPYFRKPINRLIIYASIGNVFCNLGTIISISGIPDYGASLELCRFQGFLMQMFMPADAMWTFSMALNVYLTFFRKYDANDLRNLELRYVAINYGVWFLPSIVYLILDLSPIHTHIYGNAGLWCWVTKDYEWARFAFFYVPLWVVILATISIYICTGREIFRQRSYLRNSHGIRRNLSDPPIPLLETGNPFTANIQTNRIQRVTEIEVISEDVMSRDNDSMTISQCKTDHATRSSFSSTRQLSPPAHAHIKSDQQETAPHCVCTGQKDSCNTCCNSAIWPFSNDRQTDRDINKFFATASVTAGPGDAGPDTRFANLDRVESGGSASGAQQQRDDDPNKLHTRYGIASDAAWGYAKVAFLMFIALFIVWIPATANRVYTALHGGKTSHGIALACAACAPTQGFWNCMIYVATSRSQCRAAWLDTVRAMARLTSSLRERRKGKGGRLASTSPTASAAEIVVKVRPGTAVREMENA